MNQSSGVRIQNNGTGTASKVKIESAQPEIVENNQGLLIDFSIISSTLNDQPRAPTLLIDFGDIDANTATVGRWLMASTLSGEFTEFSATYSHADELGGSVTSLLEDVNTHHLVHDVLVDLTGRDGVRDFLAIDNGALQVYESDNVDTAVTDQSATAVLQFSSQSGDLTNYTFTTAQTAGFMFAKVADPFSGGKRIRKVIRADGKRLSLHNVWISKERAGAGEYDAYFNLFDINTSGIYSIVFEDINMLPQAPVLQFIPDRMTHEGRPTSFLIEASDPNGTVPAIMATNIPTGVVLNDQGNGQAVFAWTPAAGQAGNYEITYTATDGTLSTTRKAYIKVNPANDTDGDGMEDAWELEHFGTLDRDGSGDFDGDGISDLDEYLQDKDPTQSEIFNFVLGTATTTTDWNMLTLDTFSNPVFITGVPTDNEAEPVIVRLRNVNPTGAEIRLQEWLHQDGEHAAESIPYLVIEAGRHSMSDGSSWEVGTFDLVSEQRWQPHAFVREFSQPPQLYLTIQTDNDSEPVVVRARNVSTSGFEVALFEAENSTDHGREVVGFVAIDATSSQGAIELGGSSYTFSSSIVAIDHTSTLLNDGVTSLQLQEETSQDEELLHIQENVAVLVLNNAVFAQDNSTFEADTIAPRRNVDVLTAATPVISPAGGTISEPVAVTISTTTANTIIYYTLDGSDPDPANTATTHIYTEPLTVSGTTTVKAMAVLAGSADSLVATINYTFVVNTAPTFIVIPDRTVAEEQALSFIVQSLDQNSSTQAVVTVDLSALPGTPVFNDNGDGTGQFSWIAPAGAAQNSPYTLEFAATDALDSNLVATHSMQITAVTADSLDTDQDGMPDVWELQYDLNPDESLDADADPDGDGRNNLEEYQLGGNPNIADGPVANNPPVALISADTTAGFAPMLVQFVGSGSTDEDGTVAGYVWDFADGGSSTDTNPAHTFVVPGEYTVNLTVTDDDGASNLTSLTIAITLAPDITPPVITVNGDNPASVVIGQGYTDPGATAIDDRDAEVTVTSTGIVNANTIGEYTITYTAVDAAGNEATATRSIIVALAPDTTAPVITILGVNPVNLILGSEYTDAGATAADDRDNVVAVIPSGSVDTSTVGEYTITYAAVDAAGNGATATRSIIVALAPDTTAPVITILGANPVSLLEGSEYSDAGATAMDDRDVEVTVTSAGAVDINTIGEYSITYTAVDTAGNEATAIRTVTVTQTPDTTAPVITIAGTNPVSVIEGEAYIDAGASAEDDRDIAVTITSTGTVDTNTLGEYSITYTAVDSSGNEAEATRNVIVTPAEPVEVNLDAEPNDSCSGIVISQLDGATGYVNLNGTGTMGTGWDVDRYYFAPAVAGTVVITLTSTENLTIKAGTSCGTQTFFRSENKTYHQETVHLDANETFAPNIFYGNNNLPYELDIEFTPDGGSGGSSTTIAVQINSGQDDAEETASGWMTTASNDLEMVQEGTTQLTVGVRFPGLTIPEGATIISAYIQFVVDEESTGTTNLVIKGQDKANAPAFIHGDYHNISSRTTTSASVTWTPPDWNIVDANGTDQQTSELKTIVQEIVDRAGWHNGNAMAFIITGTGSGTRIAESYEGEPNAAPKLHIEYSTGNSTITDSDNDGMADDIDNCPNDSNVSQTDTDSDGIGDTCDPTPDGGDSTVNLDTEPNDSCPGVVISQLDGATGYVNLNGTGTMGTGWDVDRYYFAPAVAGTVVITLTSTENLTIKAGTSCGTQTFFRSENKTYHQQTVHLDANKTFAPNIFYGNNNLPYELDIEFTPDG